MVDVLLCSTYEDQKQDFVFDFKDRGKLQRLTVPIPIPLKISAKEFVQRLIAFHNLPCYLESGKRYLPCTSEKCSVGWGMRGVGGGGGLGLRGGVVRIMYSTGKGMLLFSPVEIEYMEIHTFELRMKE